MQRFKYSIILYYIMSQQFKSVVRKNYLSLPKAEWTDAEWNDAQEMLNEVDVGLYL